MFKNKKISKIFKIKIGFSFAPPPVKLEQV